MTKFFKNLYKLFLLNTPIYIIIRFIKNFLPNYKTKRKSLKIENEIYKNFLTVNKDEKWFCNNLYFLKKNLRNFNGVENILEIGSYEGRSAIFFLEQFVNSKITCVDTWSGSDEHSNKNFFEVEKNFDKNLSSYFKRLTKFKIDSKNFFITNKKKFDLIYVDGDHSCEQVDIDINRSWEILKKNGYLILDDYLWWYYKDLKKNPAHPINNFIIKNISEFKNLVVWKQIIIQKK